MCLVAIAWQAHPRYPLIIAGNRDEFHARATAGADWWGDVPGVYGGRDLVAGGSWLALNRNGRFALVTNHPGRAPGPHQTASRGALVRNWVAGNYELPQGFLHRVGENERQYGGFCLVVGAANITPEGLVVPPGSTGPRWRLPEGITGLSNGPREQLPPKALWLEREYQRLLGADDVSIDELFRPLALADPVERARGPAAEGPFAQVRLTPFVRGDAFGTRSSTVVVVTADGQATFSERRFGPNGVPAGESRTEFELNLVREPADSFP